MLTKDDIYNYKWKCDTKFIDIFYSKKSTRPCFMFNNVKHGRVNCIFNNDSLSCRLYYLKSGSLSSIFTSFPFA